MLAERTAANADRKEKAHRGFLFFFKAVTLNILEAPEIRNYILPLPSP